MSKTNKRKSNESKNNKEQKRQSVFERLGTKERVTSNHLSLTVNTSTGGQEFCRNWAQNGACPFGKNCKLSNTHILISPSKRNNKKDDLSGNLKILTERAKGEEGKRVVSTLSRRVGSPELNSWETWDQTELEYEDEKVLEKRRQLLQRELDLHMKKDSRKDTSAKVQRRSSSTSSCSSSSSGSSSSSVSSSESSANRRTDVKKKKRSTSSPSGSERNLKKTRGKLSVKESTPRKSSSSGGSKKLPSPTRKRKKSTSSTPPRKLAPPPTSPSKNRSSMTNSRRKESPERRGRTGSSERKKHRSTSRNRRRGSSPRPVSRRPRTPDSKISSSSSSSRQPRNRSSDRKKEDDRKRDVHDDRSREKARELREAAREKERSEALERCRERQREREAAAKEKDRLREERERERKEAAAKRDRDRKERRNSRERRRPDDKRHDRMYDRKISDERERRDRALERVMERKSVERSRERDRGRDSYERSRKIIDEKPYASPYRCDKRRYDMREGLSPHDERLTSPYRSGEKRRYDALREGLSPREERICSPGYRSEKRGRYDMSPREDRMRNYSDERRRERNRPSGGWNGEGSSNRFEERDKSTSRGDWERDFQETPRRDWESRRNHLENEKDRASVDEKEKDSEGLQSKRISRGSGDEIEETAKKPRIEDTSSLQEELSDISDDADDILNREDVEFMEGDESRLEGENEQVDQDESSQSHQQPVSPEHRGIESRLGEDEGMVGLDFEEISDEELEEESKMNKGGSVGDALGVDWASLMATCKQQRKPANESSARSYWETGNMLARIGVSKTMASPTMYSTLKEKYPQAFPNEKHGDVAALCRPLRESKSMKEKLISSNMLHKQALSARADLSIRRQLCGLPVVTLETHQNIGFCQWTV